MGKNFDKSKQALHGAFFQPIEDVFTLPKDALDSVSGQGSFFGKIKQKGSGRLWDIVALGPRLAWNAAMGTLSIGGGLLWNAVKNSPVIPFRTRQKWGTERQKVQDASRKQREALVLKISDNSQYSRRKAA